MQLFKIRNKLFICDFALDIAQVSCYEYIHKGHTTLGCWRNSSTKTVIFMNELRNDSFKDNFHHTTPPDSQAKSRY